MSGPIPMSAVLQKTHIDSDNFQEPGIWDAWPPEMPRAEKPEMAIGDVDSKEMGSAARANKDKPNWSLMSLQDIAYLMRSYEALEHILESIPDYDMDARLTEVLGKFQAGQCDIEDLLISAVAYNWNMVKKHGEFADTTLMESLESVIAVWEYGLIKYSEFNWATGAPWSVPIACMQRHINWHWDKGEVLDKESKQFHSAHVVCNAMMLAHYSQYWKEGDDRPIFAFQKEKEKSIKDKNE